MSSRVSRIAKELIKHYQKRGYTVTEVRSSQHILIKNNVGETATCGLKYLERQGMERTIRVINRDLKNSI